MGCREAVVGATGNGGELGLFSPGAKISTSGVGDAMLERRDQLAGLTETTVVEAAKLYDRDFYAWTRDQAVALRRLARERWNGPLDLEHLAEEVEDLGKSELSTVRSQLDRVLEHLLKLEYSPAAEPRRGWILSVLEARNQIEDHATATIQNELGPQLTTLYRRARRRAAVGLSVHGEQQSTELPQTCPYGFDQVLDGNWFPQNRHGLVDAVT